jgi:glycosyltransferase involved in cell wall biosynthesis
VRLIINGSSIYKGGAEQVALSFIHECQKYPEHEYHVVIRANLADQIEQDEFPGNFKFYLIDKRPASSPFQFIKVMRWLNRLEKSIQPDCVISTGGHGYWRPKVPIAGGFNIPHYIYPESPYFSSISFKKRLFWKVKRKVHLYFFNRLDAIFVQTDDVKERLSKVLSSGAPIYKVSNTVNSCFLSEQKMKHKLPEKQAGELRLLTVSSYYPHKNLAIIKPVVKLLEEKGLKGFKFILTLPPEKFDLVFGDVGDRVVNVGPVRIDECPTLYRECDFMFLPTLLECFSASYAEAMATRKPILTSDMSFAHTVCQDAAVYFDPVDPVDIANKIIALHGDEEKQEYLRDRGEAILKTYSFAGERAGRYLEICSEISSIGTEKG